MKRLMFFLLLPALIAGCRATRTVYVPKEVVRTESRDRFLRDSTFVRDSIFVAVKGDTVWRDRFRCVYRDRFLRDTVFMRDSISYPVYVDVIKEVKHIPRFFWWCFVVALASVGWGLVKLALKIRKFPG